MEPKVFFTSDTHFNHANVIEYCNRPFYNVEHMNRELVRLWNETVGPLDLTYLLGDFTFGNKSKISEARSKLNGKIILIKGNHDRGKETMLERGFDEVYDYLDLNTSYGLIRMEHKPKKVVAPYDYFLCGHVHNHFTRIGNVINVGCDKWGYQPRTLDELIAAVPEQLDIEFAISSYEERRKR